MKGFWWRIRLRDRAGDAHHAQLLRVGAALETLVFNVSGS
jgi:hypothetical protein